MKVWAACQAYDPSEWDVLRVFSSEEKALAYIRSLPITIWMFADYVEDSYLPKWVIEVNGENVYVEDHESLFEAIIQADARDNFFVEEWEVD